MKEWVWNDFKNEYPEKKRWIYVTSNDNRVSILYIHQDEDFKIMQSMCKSWCYVFIPDAAVKKRLERCGELKGLSNDYILSLEDRLEWLEKKVEMWMGS
jgi:hypothetical protein